MAKSKAEPRTVVWVDETNFVEGEGYRVSVVVEGEAGHHPTGDWPYQGKPGQKRPWFWGPTLEDAERQCDEYNARMGVSKEDAVKIIDASIRKQLRGTKRRAKSRS